MANPHLLKVHNSADIRFIGFNLAHVKSSDGVELDIYKTSTSYVCTRSFSDQEKARNPDYPIESAASFTDESDVIKFFGYSALAKELYREAHIDADITLF